MVYRIAGVYRRRIDEIRPHFPDAELIEGSDETMLLVNPPSVDGAGAEIRATPAGFNIHWWSANPSFVDNLRAPGYESKALRQIIYSRLGAWSAELNDNRVYADFNRQTGALIVGQYRLFPFAADPDLSARVIRQGLADAEALRRRVERLIQEHIDAIPAAAPGAPG